MNRKRDIGQEILDGIRAIKTDKGKRYAKLTRPVYAPLRVATKHLETFLI